MTLRAPPVALDPTAVSSAAAALFEPVSLDELGPAALMDRIDRKYMFSSDLLPDLLGELACDYRVLQVDGRRLTRYVTRYFDTPDLALYLAHHNDRSPRFKVRVRAYEGGQATYLEVKEKTRAGRTSKRRMRLDDPTAFPPGDWAALVDGADDLPFGALGETVTVEYQRLTLVRKEGAERVTLDLMLAFRRAGEARVFPHVVIAEVKQAGQGASPFVVAMRARAVRPGGISKYCAAVANLDPAAKSNRFRPALRRLAAIGAYSDLETRSWIS